MRKNSIWYGFTFLSSVLLFGACQEKQVLDKTLETNQTMVSSNDEIENNKKIVLEFYQMMFGDKDLSAVDKYIDADYIQHNPTVADGAAAFKTAAAGWFEGAPKTKVDVQRIAAEGDLVFIHIKNIEPDHSLVSTIDIFRLKNGKIVEHWDVHQAVPDQAANAHPMF